MANQLFYSCPTLNPPFFFKFILLLLKKCSSQEFQIPHFEDALNGLYCLYYSWILQELLKPPREILQQCPRPLLETLTLQLLPLPGVQEADGLLEDEPNDDHPDGPELLLHCHPLLHRSIQETTSQQFVNFFKVCKGNLFVCLGEEHADEGRSVDRETDLSVGWSEEEALHGEELLVLFCHEKTDEFADNLVDFVGLLLLRKGEEYHSI